MSPVPTGAMQPVRPQKGSRIMTSPQAPALSGHALPGRRTAGHHVLPLAAVLVAVLVVLAGGPVARSWAVINGNTPDTAPSWAVLLLGLEDETGTRCSGVLVAANLVLTARHCRAIGATPTAFVGRSHVWAATTGMAALVVATYAHPTEDLAVMQLDEPVRPAPIAISPDDASAGPDNIPYTIYGYGRINDTPQIVKYDDRLHTAVGLRSSCPAAAAPPPRFCLQPPSIQAAAEGDSGGPAVNAQGQLSGIAIAAYPADGTTFIGKKWVIVGIAGSVRTWLDEIIRDHGQSPA
jgi:hypothetical protein